MAIQQSMSFLLLLVVTVTAGGPSSVITSTCSAVAKSSSSRQTAYDDCVRTLSAYPGAASAADARGLAIAAANLTVANVTHTAGVLEELIGNLQHCLETYKGMRDTVAGGIDDLRAGHVDAAVDKLTHASGLPMLCLLPFMYTERKSPIDKEITADISLCDLATSVAKVLKSAPKV
ncbi:unnamed protein product [Alopecurus aequalis]